MVQISNQIFTELKNEVKEAFPNVKIQKDYQSVSSTFPTVTFCEIDNTELSHTLDYTERKSSISFQIDIYTVNGAKETQAKMIAQKGNDIIEVKWHMKREYSKPTVNADQNIYRTQ